MLNSEQLGVEHAMEFIADHGLVDREELLSLAANAEDGDIDAESRLRDLATQHNLDWDGDSSSMADKIATAIEAQTEDDPLGNDFE
jgi:hypothetical protein